MPFSTHQAFYVGDPVESTCDHPKTSTPGGWERNPNYTDCIQFLTTFLEKLVFHNTRFQVETWITVRSPLQTATGDHCLESKRQKSNGLIQRKNLDYQQVTEEDDCTFATNTSNYAWFLKNVWNKNGRSFSFACQRSLMRLSSTLRRKKKTCELLEKGWSLYTETNSRCDPVILCRCFISCFICFI